MSRDVIFIVSTEQNLKTFSFDFVNEFYPYVNYGLHRFKTDRAMLIRNIEGNSEWLNRIKEKATNNGISLERMIRTDAEWVLFNQ